jgi:hypothetical protein
VHIAAVSERSPGSDERLAALFCDMRLCLGASKAELARRLRTTPAVIDSLENGRMHRLPPWPETVRIVTELGALHGVDTRPALERIRQQVGPAGLGQRPDAMPRIARATERQARRWWRRGVRGSDRLAGEGREHPSAKRRKRYVARALFTLSAPIVLVAGGLGAAQVGPAGIRGAISELPAPAARLVRPLVDFVAVRFAPVHDGLRWITVSDPRSRKADRLAQSTPQK